MYCTPTADRNEKNTELAQRGNKIIFSYYIGVYDELSHCFIAALTRKRASCRWKAGYRFYEYERAGHVFILPSRGPIERDSYCNV